MQHVFDKMQDALGTDLLGYGLLLVMLGTSSAFAFVILVNSLRSAISGGRDFHKLEPVTYSEPQKLDWTQSAQGRWSVLQQADPILSSYQEKRLLAMVRQQSVANRLIQHEVSRGATGRAMAAEWAADRLERERRGGWV